MGDVQHHAIEHDSISSLGYTILLVDIFYEKYTFNDYYHDPEGKIAKRMIYKAIM